MAAMERSAETTGWHWIGAKPTSQCFDMTKIWSIVLTIFGPVTKWKSSALSSPGTA
jgi:hypothetical protein